MNRREFVGASLSAAAVLRAQEQRSAAPNVIVFFTDQQRWDSLGVYGSPMNLTPNIDRVAGEGTVFEYAFTPQPVCSPVHSSILTGKYPTTTGVIRNGIPLKDGETTLPCSSRASVMKQAMSASGI